MSDFESSLNDLGDLSNEAAADADAQFSKEIAALKELGTAGIEKLKPQITDQATYDKLIKVVQEAAAKNESIAQIVDRVKGLGQGAVSLAKKIATLV
jgi:hypothetical protein